MAEATKSERQDGLLWGIARLHPGVLWLLYFATFFLIGSIPGSILVEVGSVLKVIVGLLILLSWWAYPLFVIAFLSRVFTSSSPERLKRAVGAFAFVGLWVVVVAFVSSMFLSKSADLPPGVQFALDVTVVPLFAALFYLWIAASLALVQAEKGSAYSGKHVFGAFLLFFYLPAFGAYFLQRRIQRFARDQAESDSLQQQLPMERMVLAPMKSGHLSLELTEFPNWRSFERYAEALLCRLDGQVVRKGSGVDMHIWSIEIESVPLRMIYEDFPNRVSLESDSDSGDTLLRQFHQRLAPSATA